MKVLAIGAHPDDIELGCGATLAKHASQDTEVRAVVVTNGEAQRGVQWQERIREAREAQNVLGGGVAFFLGIEERNVCTVEHRLVERIRQEIERFRPDVLYCHSEHDRHQTHQAVAQATVIAAHLENIPRVFKFEVPSANPKFAPTAYSDVTMCMDAKLAALSCYESQAERYYMLPRAIEGLAHYRAYQMRFDGEGDIIPAAEAFEVERMVL